ncbi:MAG: type II toxin-antitoxin system VapC family toxin [Solirubrobacterales bacterium]|nr:type II toxin-antitoxin system VapC family toxin [Solirubrobacterales bacterium]
MRLLLDTNIVIWQLEGELNRFGAALETLKAAEEIFVSAISFVEIAVKASVGKLRLSEDLHERVLESGARILNVAPEHGLGIAELPLHHRDPFDRLLISQARRERLTILTSDAHFAAYDVPVLFASA